MKLREFLKLFKQEGTFQIRSDGHIRNSYGQCPICGVHSIVDKRGSDRKFKIAYGIPANELKIDDKLAHFISLASDNCYDDQLCSRYPIKHTIRIRKKNGANN